MAERPQTLEELRSGDYYPGQYRLDPTVLGQGAQRATQESLLPSGGPPLSVEEWRTVNQPGRFNPVEAIIGLAGGPRLRAPRITGFDPATGQTNVYHTSPYDFNQFSMDYVGKGQGAQSFGRGQYFAESPRVSGPGGEYWEEFSRHPSISPGERRAAQYMKAANFDRERAIIEAARGIERYKQVNPPSRYETRAEADNRAIHDKYNKLDQEALQILESDRERIRPVTYDVALKAKPEQFLKLDKPIPWSDWEKIDKPLRESIEGWLEGQGRMPVGEAFARGMQDPRYSKVFSGMRGENVVDKPYTGRDLYNLLSEPSIIEEFPSKLQPKSFGSVKESERERYSTRYMKEAMGIPGTTYLDAHSRNLRPWAVFSKDDKVISTYNTKEGAEKALRAPGEHMVESGYTVKETPVTSNYAVWDTRIIDIMRKLGIIGGATGAGAVATKGDKAEAKEPEKEK